MLLNEKMEAIIQNSKLIRSNFNLKYELYDIKTRGFIYMGRANIKPITLSQAPSEIFKHLRNARNQILHQIINYRLKYMNILLLCEFMLKFV